MEPIYNQAPASQDLMSHRSAQASLPQLVGQVYAAAPPPERSRLLEFLMRPLGVLPLVVIADGIFAKIRFGTGSDLHVTLEDANLVQPADIVQLVDRVQQVSSDAMDGLATIVASSPVISTSAAAAMLVALLVQHQLARRTARQLAQPDPDLDPPA